MADTSVDVQMDLMRQVKARMDALKQTHPQWCNDYEDIDPMTADRDRVEELLKSAPNDWASGMIAGVMAFRQQLSIVTGREF